MDVSGDAAISSDLTISGVLFGEHKGSISYVIDGGAAIATGVKGDLQIPFNCTLETITMLADQSGSILLTSVLFLFNRSAEGAWLSGYTYRRAITIDNTGYASALTDYQVKVTNPIYDESGLVGSWHMEEGL